MRYIYNFNASVEKSQQSLKVKESKNKSGNFFLLKEERDEGWGDN